MEKMPSSLKRQAYNMSFLAFSAKTIRFSFNPFMTEASVIKGLNKIA